MDTNFPLQAISPIDGRYSKQTEILSTYFSEGALIKYRVRVEIEYFIALCNFDIDALADFDKNQFENLRKIYLDFTQEDALTVKKIEKTTNHDVKAVEYFIKGKFEALGLGKHKEFIHFGLTSQDINNTAQPLMLKEAMEEVIYPEFHSVLLALETRIEEWKSIPMLAKTHGQPASPTILGKEIEVFVERLYKQMFQLKLVAYSAKFGGATGNFNAHYVAYP
ncbi:MAG: lyase family protein, partial [Bacteroidales bacterium]